LNALWELQKGYDLKAFLDLLPPNRRANASAGQQN